jgi:hypothetical protein
MAHQHYKGTGQMHSFRGLLADGGQDKIRIEGATGQIAWRISKFQIMPESVAATRNSVLSIWREEQSSIVQGADFNNDELLAVAVWYNQLYETDDAVIFDNALFNRNIYIGHHNSEGTDPCNYYIELEEVKVSAAGMAQLAVAAARRT